MQNQRKDQYQMDHCLAGKQQKHIFMRLKTVLTESSQGNITQDTTYTSKKQINDIHKLLDNLGCKNIILYDQTLNSGKDNEITLKFIPSH